MKFASTVAQAFSELGYTPKNNQSEIINSILEAFISRNRKNVILCADTGIGKSIIGAVLARAIGIIEEAELHSFILMHNNVLVHQYADTFEKLTPKEFTLIKGASQYPCAFLDSRMIQNVTAEDCVKDKLTSFETDKYCKTCEFACSRKMINKTQNLITNYSFYLTLKMNVPEALKERSITIFDEAHIFNEIFCDHTGIEVTTERIDYYVRELTSQAPAKSKNHIASLLMLKNLIHEGKVIEENYRETLTTLSEVYANCGTVFYDMAKDTSDMTHKVKLMKVYKKYKNLAAKIDGFFQSDYDCIFDNSVKDTITLKTIFVNDSIHPLLSKYNLFMSATINESFCTETLGLEKFETEFIKAEPVFDSKNRPLLFLGKESLNYKNMQDPNTVSNLKNTINAIVDSHKAEKGIILVPSFKMAREIASGLKGVKVFEHVSQTKVADILHEFKKYKGPSVMISPSLFEGLDFSGDLSRYQIITKTPYASLGDKRIKYILDNYPSIYELMTLMKVIQGIGRSIRSKEDTAVTYFLDKSTQRLFDSKQNIWKDRFDIKVKQ